MSTRNTRAFQKGCLMTLLQIALIIVSYCLISISYSFQETIRPELKCMDLPNANKLCISLFQRNSSVIPYNKAAQANSLHLNQFTVLQLEQSQDKLQDLYKNSIEEYFQIINYDNKLQSEQDITLDSKVLQIQQLMTLWKGKLNEKVVNKFHLYPSTKVAVFYSLLPNSGPQNIMPKIKITYPNYNSVNVGNKIYLIQCFGGLIIILAWIFYRVSATKRQPNEGFFTTQQFVKASRPIQFLLNFGINNLVYFLTVNHYWSKIGLNWLNQLIGFEKSLVPMMEANIYESFVGLFPQWLLLSYFIFLVIKRYLNQPTFKLIMISGFLGTGLFVLPLYWPQFIFELSIIGAGIYFSISKRTLSNNKLTIPLVFTALSLILMMLIKIIWISSQRWSNDFMLRYFFNQIFIINNFTSLFLSDDKITAQNSRKYIPYEEYTMEQQPENEEHNMVPHAEKLTSQEE